MNEINNIELLEKYFNYELNEEEDTFFKKKLTNDKAFKEEYEIALVLRAKALEKRKQAYKNLNLSTGKTVKTIPLKKYLPLLIAATILIVVAISLFRGVGGFDEELRIAEFFNPDNKPPISSIKSDFNYPNLINEARKAYQENDFKLASSKFMQQANESIIDDQWRYFWGLSLCYNNNYQNAITVFKEIKPANNFFEDAQFQAAICHLQLDQFNEAKPILKALINNDNFGNKEKRKLIKTILRKI